MRIPTAHGYIEIRTAQTHLGAVQVRDLYWAIRDEDEQVTGHMLTLRECRLSGTLITDPQRAAELATLAGLA
jgi:hypothetical protein